MSKGDLQYVVGDVTNPQRHFKNEVAIIPHCCNNLGVMGAGVAFALKTKWPQAEKEYLNNGYRIGSVSFASIRDNNETHTVIANMVAQEGLKSKNNLKPIKYYYLIKCMEKVFNFIDIMKFENENKKIVIHAPEFGGLRAGGNFAFIRELIQEMWVDNGIDVKIYQFK